jgi:hypothetical protein
LKLSANQKRLGAAFAGCFFIAVSASAQEVELASSIGYESVAAALAALKARSDVKMAVYNGWTLASDAAEKALWSFTPPTHPAYPAAVKRTVFERNGRALIDVSALCEASKRACDELIAEFPELRRKNIEEDRDRSATGTTH